MEKGGGERLTFGESAELPVGEADLQNPSVDIEFKPVQPNREVGPAPTVAPSETATSQESEIASVATVFSEEDLTRDVAIESMGAFEDRMSAGMED